jgi:Na+-translocating ferredoxin:NAD+ oxidoreductase subunit G
MREIYKPVIVLFVICSFVTFLVAATYNVTKGTILDREIEENNRAMNKVMAGGDPFMEITGEVMSNVNPGSINIHVNNAYSSDKGYVFNITAKGYGGDMVITIGINRAGEIAGIKIGSNNETPSIGKKAEEPGYTSLYAGLDINENLASKVDVIGGATITSKAVMNAVSDVIKVYNQYARQEGLN